MIIVPVAGLRKILPPKTLWKGYQLSLKIGDDLNLDELLNKLIKMGYVRAEMVSAPGEFSVRGGILDIYPLTEADPIRIELFDTEIDSIRTFSLDDQRSKVKQKEIKIGPATEIILETEHFEKLISNIETGLSKSLKIVKQESIKSLLTQNIEYELEQLRMGHKPEQIFKYLIFCLRQRQ